jgi:hypothetical protein
MQVNTLNSSHGQPAVNGAPAWGNWQVLNVTQVVTIEQTLQCGRNSGKGVLDFENASSHCRTDSLTSVAEE